jgi:hypothetical protein
MEQLNEVSGEDFDEMVGHLEEVYGNAYWALRYGATKESLFNQIEQALEMSQDELKEGRIVGPGTDAAEGPSPA